MSQQHNRIDGPRVELRVHDLAKELGVTSKEILAWCNAYEEFIKSARSTLRAPLIRRLRAQFTGNPPYSAVFIPPSSRALRSFAGVPQA
jgi:translation initiation factor IF-2